MNTLTITLPHTARVLSPNASAPISMRGAMTAARKKIAAKKRAKEKAWAITYDALNGKTFKPDAYEILWYFEGRKPDMDNVHSRCKYYIDGACLAFSMDDSAFKVSSVKVIHDKTKAGTVELIFRKELNQ